MRLEFFQQTVGLNVAEVAGMPIPRESFPLVALCTANIGALEEGGIESCPHAQRSVPVSHCDSALVKEPRRGNVPGAEKRIATRHQRRGIRSRYRRVGR